MMGSQTPSLAQVRFTPSDKSTSILVHEWIRFTTETIRTGGPADYLGAITLGGFDSNADGTTEFVYSVRNATREAVRCRYGHCK